eukprot:TRINITY_DN1027_c0_g1_i1.p1 TRINITY_DN1027_c0_g1~~TRINITY_DN1027_c0_g1_i1.p1  ORF type:complete len:445 (-),score=46.11 TRINITY_DN1027_c0_g1_i1:89-1423(-)
MRLAKPLRIAAPSKNKLAALVSPESSKSSQQIETALAESSTDSASPDVKPFETGGWKKKSGLEKLQKFYKENDIDLPEAIKNKEKVEISVEVYNSRKQHYEVLVGHLTNEDMILSKLFTELLPRESRDKIFPKIVKLWASKDFFLDFLKCLVQTEVDLNQKAGTLFRSNSIASSIMTHHIRIVGKNLLSDSLKGRMLEIMKLLTACNFPYEIDKHRLKGSIGFNPDQPLESQINQNVINISTLAENMIKSIFDSAKNIPETVREICRILQQTTQEKFAASKYSVIGGYLFLRFFCPAILSPDGFGVISVPVTPDVRRAYILISKLIQQLANQTQFGAKEEYMIPLNGFLDTHKSQFTAFIDSLTENTPESVLYEAYSITPLDLVEIHEAIHLAFYDSLPKFEKHAESLSENDEIRARIVSIKEAVHALGNPRDVTLPRPSNESL